MQSWYALYTKPKSERKVQASLDADGIETYFPVLPVPHRAGRPDERAFFPCYLFAHLDLAFVGISRLNWRPGMRSIVTFDAEPARVDERIVFGIRSRLSENRVLDAAGHTLLTGDRVVITDGPLANLDAVFDKRLSPAGRVRVLIQLMQRWTAVEMEASSVKKLGG
jgi:transcriptional antiterminator RfaH